MYADVHRIQIVPLKLHTVIQKILILRTVKYHPMRPIVTTIIQPNHTMSVAKAVLNVHPQVIIVLEQPQFV